MSRPFTTFCMLTLAIASGVLTSGCETQKTVYSDMYSPRRSRFVPPVEKRVVTELPPEPNAQALLQQAATPVTPATPPPAVVPDATQPAPSLPGADASMTPMAQ